MLIELSKVSKIVTGGTPSTANNEYWENGDIPWLQSGCCQNCYVTEASKYITKSGYDNSVTKMMPANTILIALTGATAGKIGYLTFEACGNQSITGITPDESKLLPKFLYYFLIARRDKTVSDCTGGAQPHISQEYVKHIMINLPAISEQREIVKILDSLNALKAKEETETLFLNELIKSRFIELFGNVIDNEKGWNTYKLNDVCDVRDGTHDSPKYVSDGYPFVTSKNITNGELDFSNVQYISKADYLHFEDRSHVDDGDILMPMIGTVGGAVIVKKDRDFSIKNVCLIKFCRTNMVLNVYIKYVLNSDEMNLYFDSLKKGGNQPFIGLNTIRNLQIPIPTMDKQQKFVTFVESIDKLKFSNPYYWRLSA